MERETIETEERRYWIERSPEYQTEAGEGIWEAFDNQKEGLERMKDSILLAGPTTGDWLNVDEIPEGFRLVSEWEAME